MDLPDILTVLPPGLKLTTSNNIRPVLMTSSAVVIMTDSPVTKSQCSTQTDLTDADFISLTCHKREFVCILLRNNNNFLIHAFVQRAMLASLYSCLYCCSFV